MFYERLRYGTQAVISILAFSVFVSVPVSAKTPAETPVETVPERPPLATMLFEAGAIAFQTPSLQALTLKVGGQGYQFKRRFAPGQIPFFEPVDGAGFTLPDGVYVWELVENPELLPSRESGAGRPAHGRETHQQPALSGQRHAGGFSVRDGRLVDPGLMEPRESGESTAQALEPARTAGRAERDDNDGHAKTARDQ